jgi:hypothetical protein
LSDRRIHLVEFEKKFKERGFTSIGYYVGGMKAEAREQSATKQIILGTFTLAAEGMNIRDLNTIALVTPKSNIEQAVGRIFRLKKEERVFSPLIFDVIDSSHSILKNQYVKRRKFYNQCKYKINVSNIELYSTTENPLTPRYKPYVDSEDELEESAPMFSS